MSGPDRPAGPKRAVRAARSLGSGWALAASCAACFLLAAACRQDMFDQPKMNPLNESDFFDDGSSARVQVADTVARGQLVVDKALATGIGPDGKFVAELPVPLTRPMLERGRERFDIFCSPCHDRIGRGRGMIVQRGFKQPPSYHIERLRSQPIGYLFDVMSNGFGEMPSYASQVPVEDRWAIAAYVRVLQLSQHAPVLKIPERDRRAIEAPAPSPGGETEGGHG